MDVKRSSVRSVPFSYVTIRKGLPVRNSFLFYPRFGRLHDIVLMHTCRVPFSTVRRAKADSINDASLIDYTDVLVVVCGACCMQVQESSRDQGQQQRYD